MEDLLNKTVEIQLPTTVFYTVEQLLEAPTYDEARESIFRLKITKQS